MLGPIGTLDLVSVSGDAGALNEPLRRYTTRCLASTAGGHRAGAEGRVGRWLIHHLGGTGQREGRFGKGKSSPKPLDFVESTSSRHSGSVILGAPSSRGGIPRRIRRREMLPTRPLGAVVSLRHGPVIRLGRSWRFAVYSDGRCEMDPPARSTGRTWLHRRRGLLHDQVTCPGHRSVHRRPIGA